MYFNKITCIGQGGKSRQHQKISGVTFKTWTSLLQKTFLCIPVVKIV